VCPSSHCCQDALLLWPDALLPIQALELFQAINDGLTILLRELRRASLDDMGHRIDVVAITATAQTGSFQRNGSSTRKGVEHGGHLVLESLDGGLQFCLALLHPFRLDMAVFDGIESFFNLGDSIVVSAELCVQRFPA